MSEAFIDQFEDVRKDVQECFGSILESEDWKGREEELQRIAVDGSIGIVADLEIDPEGIEVIKSQVIDIVIAESLLFMHYVEQVLISGHIAFPLTREGYSYQRARTSPAVLHQAINYPASYCGDVPYLVKTLKDIYPSEDGLNMLPVMKGVSYQAWVTSEGEVWAWVSPDSRVRLDEYEIVSWDSAIEKSAIRKIRQQINSRIKEGAIALKKERL